MFCTFCTYPVIAWIYTVLELALDGGLTFEYHREDSWGETHFAKVTKEGHSEEIHWSEDFSNERGQHAISIDKHCKHQKLQVKAMGCGHI